MERVHILARVNPQRDLFRIQMRGKRKLNQNSVNPAVRIQTVDQRVQIRLLRPGGETVYLAAEPDLLAGARLVAHVNLRGGIFAHNDDRKPGGIAVLRNKRHAVRFQLRPNRGGNLFSVNQFHCTALSPLTMTRSPASNRRLARR